MVPFLSEGLGPLGCASKEQSLWDKHLWTLHLNMEPGRMVPEKQSVLRAFVVKKSCLCLSLCREDTRLSSHAASSEQEGHACHSLGPLAGEVGAI